MNKIAFKKTWLLIILNLFSCDISSGQFITSRPPWAGVWVNTFDKEADLRPYLDYIAGETTKPKWSRCEPTEGNYDFSEIKQALIRARSYNKYYYAEFWAGDRCPNWVFDKGVPEVKIKGKGEQRVPYYLDDKVQDLSEELS